MKNSLFLSVIFVSLFMSAASRADSITFQLKVLIPAVSISCEGDTPIYLIKGAAKSNILNTEPNALEYVETSPGSDDVVVGFENENVQMIVRKSESNPRKQRVEVRNYIVNSKGQHIETIREIFERQADGWAWPIDINFMKDHSAKCMIRWSFMEPEF